jgi:hypothetical protein
MAADHFDLAFGDQAAKRAESRPAVQLCAYDVRGGQK